MLSTTKAIVLSAIKYSDADLIVKCYTQLGLKSYLLKRVLKSKKAKIKAAYFQPLTHLELVAKHNNKGNLNFIKEVKINYPYKTIPFDIAKQTMILFLSEVLSKSIHEEEENNLLFEYIETALIWLDTNDEVANFHLLFLLNLTRHLGFYPEKENTDALFFDLEEGRFTNSIPRSNGVTAENLTHLKALLGINFEGLNSLKFNGLIRQSILDILVHYFELHLPGFQKPKSLAILKTVFE